MEERHRNRHHKQMLKTLLVLLYSAAQASSFSTPVGFEEAFMGNTGAALAASAGNVVYNPGGLAFWLDHNALSVSGTSIAYQELEGTAFSRQTGSLLSNSFLSAAVFNIADNVKMAAFFTYPGNTNDYFRIESSSGANARSLTQEFEHSYMVAGLAYATRATPNIGIGFHVGLSWTDIETFQSLNQTDGATSSLTTEKNTETRLGLQLMPGILWKVTDTYSTGFSVIWKALDIYATGDTYKSSHTTGQTDIDEGFQRYTPSTSDFVSALWGQQFHLGDHRFVLDLTYSPQAPLNRALADNTDPYYAASLGWKSPPFKNVAYLAGAQWSSCDENQIYLASGGLTFDIRSYTGNIGLFYQYADNQKTGGVHSDTLGFLYTSGFVY